MAIALLAILATGLWLRLAGLDDFGFNSDESVYAGQGAALVGLEPYDELFSLFRAHPLFLQLTIGGAFSLFGVDDLIARTVVAGLFGFGSVVLTYLLASELYSRTVALVSGALLATLPYHVVVSRQVLVDVPMAFFTVLSLLLLVVGLRRGSDSLIVLAALMAGLATLSKEVAVLVPVVGIIYWLLSKSWRRIRRRTVLLSTALYLLVVSTFPISRLLGPAGNSSGFVFWQFGRPPNHDQLYFVRILLQFGGAAFLALVIIGLVRMLLRRERGDLLNLTWVSVFMVFFQLWPTKLFFYLVVVVPSLAIAAGVGAEAIGRGIWLLFRRSRPRLSQSMVLGAATAAFMIFGAIFSWNAVTASDAQPRGIRDFDIEVQSFAGAREFAEWSRENTPPGSRFITMGPSIGNILRFYGHRDSVALSVGQDAGKRNPAYVPIPNPDLAIRDMAVHYLVWDAYTADRSPFYSRRLLRFVDRFGGIPIRSVYVDDGIVRETSGAAPPDADVRVVLYDVPGSNPTTDTTMEG